MKNKFYLFIILVIITSCSSPKHVLTPNELKKNTKGLYSKITLKSTTNGVNGELIEVTDKQITLLTKDGILSFKKENIKESIILVSLTVNNPRRINSWASLINLLSLGHGYWAVFSLPPTIAITNGITSEKYIMNYPENVKWEQLHKFARFPQGIPKEIDRQSIR